VCLLHKQRNNTETERQQTTKKVSMHSSALLCSSISSTRCAEALAHTEALTRTEALQLSVVFHYSPLCNALCLLWGWYHVQTIHIPRVDNNTLSIDTVFAIQYSDNAVSLQIFITYCQNAVLQFQAWSQGKSCAPLRSKYYTTCYVITTNVVQVLIRYPSKAW